jgi:hypothetical protein
MILDPNKIGKTMNEEKKYAEELEKPSEKF